MARIKTLAPLVPKLDSRTVPLGPKQADPYYLTPEHRNWRELVIARAGRRCEVVEAGARCPKGEPRHRMFADHIHERSDGGDPLDPANGQCMCGGHHSAKTMRARAARAGS